MTLKPKPTKALGRRHPVRAPAAEFCRRARRAASQGKSGHAIRPLDRGPGRWCRSIAKGRLRTATSANASPNRRYATRCTAHPPPSALPWLRSLPPGPRPDPRRSCRQQPGASACASYPPVARREQPTMGRSPPLDQQMSGAVSYLHCRALVPFREAERQVATRLLIAGDCQNSLGCAKRIPNRLRHPSPWMAGTQRLLSLIFARSLAALSWHGVIQPRAHGTHSRGPMICCHRI